MRISGIVDREVVAEQDAELRKVGTVLNADRLTYWPVDDEVEAVGNARLQRGGDVITGPKMRLRVDDQIGFVDKAAYFFKRTPVAAEVGDTLGASAARSDAPPAGAEWSSGFAAPRTIDIKPGQTRVRGVTKTTNEATEGRGEAARIDLQGENQVLLTAATYTTCKPGNDDWYLTADDLKLDYDSDVATGSNATIRFMDVPILYSPWVSFSLNNERKSGFLPPTYGSSSDSGIEFMLPYYWNIAPNMDATFEPRILTKRGLQLGTDVRYLNTALGGTYFGNARVEYLPKDRVRDIDRWGLSLTHSQITAGGFSGAVNFSRVSDNNYYTDLSSQISTTANTQLLQQGVLTGGGGWWTATANVQSFQTLQPDVKNPVAQPYRLFPQIVFNARQPDLYLTDSSFFGQYTRFVSPEAAKVDGQRIVMQPQISLPYVTPGWYVTPRIGVNLTHYSLSYPDSTSAAPSSITRSLPIFSVDSGMTFERPSRWFGRDYVQTLEPRLFYLNIPYRNQDNIPLFDSGLADFNFAQIFADNQFSGWDRINNANQLTGALSSRLIDPTTGAEIMRAMLGQRVYFADDRVALQSGSSTRKRDRSDVLAAFSGQLLPRLYADTTMQYNTTDQVLQRHSIGARYYPAPGKVLNATYSYNRETATPIKQVDFSGQWPIVGRWQAVGRYNYSFLQKQPIEIIGGLEYNAGCWAMRAVGQRVVTSEISATTRIFLQLELNDFSRLGSSPLSLLQRTIPGYGLSNQPLADYPSAD